MLLVVAVVVFLFWVLLVLVMVAEILPLLKLVLRTPFFLSPLLFALAHGRSLGLCVAIS